MNTDRDDGDLRHVFLETARGPLCHLCLKPKGHADHVPFTIPESFGRELPRLIDEARS
jgi:hypothetical protein